jgi:hypothetical protein
VFTLFTSEAVTGTLLSSKHFLKGGRNLVEKSLYVEESKSSVMQKRSIVFLLSILLMIGCSARWTMSEDIPRMTKEELKAMLDKPDLVIIDVRTSTDWARSDMKIKGAIRENHEDVNSWAGKYAKDKPIVLYCA